MDVSVGTLCSINVEFVDKHGFSQENVNSVVYTLYGHTGSKLQDMVPVILPTPNPPIISIDIPPEDNTITSWRRFEKRKLVVTWKNNEETFQVVKDYRVLPFIAYSVSPNDVRNLLGLNEDDLSDNEIDSFPAFLTIENELTESVISDALQSGTVQEMQANRLITIQTALSLLPSLQLRTSQSVMDGNRRWDRFRQPPDWEQIGSRLSELKSLAIAEITGTPQSSMTIMTVATPTDVITGA